MNYGRITYLFALCVFSLFSFYMYQPYSFTQADPGWMVWTTDSLLNDFDLDLKNQLSNDPTRASDQTSLGQGGQWYPLHEWLISLLAVPFYAVFGVNGCLVLNIILSATLVLYAFKLCVVLGLRENISFISTALVTLSSSILLMSYSFSVDVLGAMFVLASAYYLLKQNFKLSALAFSFAVFARINSVVLLPAICLYIFILKDKRSEALRGYTTVGLPAFILWALINHLMFGGPLETSYDNWQRVSDGVLVPAEIPLSYTFSFSRLYSLLFSDSGVFTCSPASLLGFVLGGYSLFRKAEPESIFLISYCFFLLTFYTVFSEVYQFATYRYFLSMMGISVVFLASAIEIVFRKQEN